jgi:hypothetical protein
MGTLENFILGRLVFAWVVERLNQTGTGVPGRVAGHRWESEQLELRHALVVFHVFCGAVVSFAETFAECLAIMLIDRGMLVDLVVIGVGATMVGEVVASSFDTFVKTATLSVLIGVRRLLPAVLIAILV